ncbi:pectin lyase fold/virulence factor [Gilbertella persicaria]|uniref:pectin lyase fold/virulence factor n=1 Tax=Gilbertella persicaria TaxID=101096 RepID=UPI00221F92BB|nr:pectin lyase fold/virulence factor [Gilbertella persicaria]KAI8079686.1 pectin lyase fold/virulence factor [Gilbertella persicaria]
MRLSLGPILALASSAAFALVSADTTVNVCSSCDYTTISDALSGLPSGSTAYTIAIAPGTYNERVTVNRSNVVLKSSGSSNVYIQYAIDHNTQDPNSHAGDKAVVTVNGSNVRFYDLIIVNSYKQTVNIATVALNVQGQQVAFYNTKFYGFQDTLLVNSGGTAFFKNCYIEGSVDYIFGYGIGYFQDCIIASNAKGYVTASNRVNADQAGGFYFNQCQLKATVPSGPIAFNANASLSFTSVSQSTDTCYLGRPWSQYARVVYMTSTFGTHINPAGWSVWKSTDPRTANVLFAEYQNGGARGTFTDQRASFATLLNESQATQYTVSKVFGSTSWIDSSV